MLEEKGTRHEAFGTYHEITPPARLVYTHVWVMEGSAGESTAEALVTVEFYEEKGATRVVLIQEGFDTPSARDDHEGGWASTLDRLDAMFARGN